MTVDLPEAEVVTVTPDDTGDKLAEKVFTPSKTGENTPTLKRLFPDKTSVPKPINQVTQDKLIRAWMPYMRN